MLSAPALLVVAGLVLAPLGLLTILSLQQYSRTQLWTGKWTVANYSRMLTDAYYLSVLWQTVRVGLLTTFFCALLGYPVAYHLARSRGAIRGVGMFLLLCPLLVSTVIRAFGWIVLLGDKGVINQGLRALGLAPLRLLYTETAVVIGMTQFLLPFMALPLMAAIERIPRNLEEAARNLGAGGPGVFRLVILPLSLPGLVAGSLLVYAITISAVITPILMGGRRTPMLGTQIYEHVLVTFNWPFAASLSMVIILVTLLVVYGSTRARGVGGRPSASAA